MKSVMLRGALGVALAGGMSVSMLFAEEATKTLPTLLIKGEVVSLDTNDPSATLLKIKDRYGFETPIFITPETKITQGDAVLALSNLSTGTSAEVEYNFDVNTAKRHAVSVKVAVPASAESAQAPAVVAPAAPAPAPAEPVAPPAEPAASESPAPAEVTPPQAEAAPAPVTQ